MSVIQVVLQIFARVNDAVQLVASVIATLITSGWYIVVRDAATLTTDIHSLLEDPTCGQTAQCTKLDTILSDLTTISMDLAALGTPQQAGSPVTLPTTPPSGYGAPSSSSNASAVWAFVSTDESIVMGNIMSALSAFLRVCADSLAFPGRLSEGFTYNFSPGDLVNNVFTSWGPFTVNSILPTHTSISDWLNDIYFHETWNVTGDGQYWANVSSPSGHALVTCTLTPGEFAWYRATNSGRLLLPNVPPVWPGLSKVTLGSPVAIAPPGATIAVPCDGVVVAITGTPPWQGNFSFGTAISWRNIGAVSFIDDNGQVELPQTLGFADAVYTPRAMTTAAGLVYRATSGVSGTITPYTVN